MFTKPKLREYAVKLGIGLRRPYELNEDLSLQTPLEQFLYNKNFKSFELIYKTVSNPDTVTNADYIYQVIMRNLPVILMEEDLHPCMENFF